MDDNHSSDSIDPSWAQMLSRLSDDAHYVLAISLGEALRIGHFWLGVELLLMGLSKQGDGPLPRFLKKAGVDPSDLRADLRGLVGVSTDQDWRRQRDVATLGKAAIPYLRIADPETLESAYFWHSQRRSVITPRLLTVLSDAVHLADGEDAEPIHLLWAAMRHPQCMAIKVLLMHLHEAGCGPDTFASWVERQAGAPLGQVAAMTNEAQSVDLSGLLGEVGRDLTALAKAGKLRPAIGESARRAMLQIGLVLQQAQANNPILLGDSGVGKTAIVEGFAWRLAVGGQHGQPVAQQLAGRQIVDLSPNALLAGMRYRGDMEERLQQLIAEVRAAKGKIVVFIDEIHTILGGKAEGGLGAMSDALKPALARGEFPCIGATTISEYRHYIEADPALARRFSPVWIEEPSQDEAIEIASIIAREYLGPTHGVDYLIEAVREAVQLTGRYIHDEFLPGKAIKVLDQAGPRVIMGGSLRGVPLSEAQSTGGTVTPGIIRQIVAERTHIPVTRLSEDDTQRLLHLETRLRERVRGQDDAVTSVARVVKRARAGLADPRRPLGVFLFAGPTGVGKTELALALEEALFGTEDTLFRLDMSEYMERHQVARLIGAPPGYLGHGEEGQLTGHLRRYPYSIVLLDEMEKAHQDIQHLFLQLFDAGRLTDSRGRLADGRNALFVMTTNLGAREALGFRGQESSYRHQLESAIAAHFTPEFLNRVDRIICFEPLNETTLLSIFDKQFSRVATRMRSQGTKVEVAEAYKHTLVRRCVEESPQQGARPLTRIIEEAIVGPLTDQLLAGDIKPGMHVIVDESGITFYPQDTNTTAGSETERDA